MNCMAGTGSNSSGSRTMGRRRRRCSTGGPAATVLTCCCLLVTNTSAFVAPSSGRCSIPLRTPCSSSRTAPNTPHRSMGGCSGRVACRCLGCLGQQGQGRSRASWGRGMMSSVLAEEGGGDGEAAAGAAASAPKVSVPVIPGVEGEDGMKASSTNSPALSKTQAKKLEKLWRIPKKELLKVGKAGVKDSHVRSLKDLLAAHSVVRVKVNDRSASLEELGRALEGRGEDGESNGSVLLGVRQGTRLILMGEESFVQSINRSGSTPRGEEEGEGPQEED